MAIKKSKLGAPSAKKAVASRKPAPSAAARTVSAPAALVQATAGSSQGLLREAAWSRMFGRTEAKNPFGRSR